MNTFQQTSGYNDWILHHYHLTHLWLTICSCQISTCLKDLNIGFLLIQLKYIFITYFILFRPLYPWFKCHVTFSKDIYCYYMLSYVWLNHKTRWLVSVVIINANSFECCHSTLYDYCMFSMATVIQFFTTHEWHQ